MFATNAAVVVWPEQTIHNEPFWREPGQDDGQATQPTVMSTLTPVNFTYNFATRWTAQHFNVAETIRVGWQYVDAHRADTDPIGQVNVDISTVTFLNSSYYDFVRDDIVIGIGANEFRAFDDEVVLHEYGHHVLDHISATTLTAGQHTGCDEAADAQYAWQEGAATFLAWAVEQAYPQVSVGATEDPSACGFTPGDEVEDRVARALWDVVDSQEPGVREAFDQLSGLDDQVMRVIDLCLDRDRGSPGATIGMFRSAWADQGFDLAKLDLILTGNGIPTS